MEVCKNTSLRDLRDQVMRVWDDAQLPEGVAEGHVGWSFEVGASSISLDKEPSVVAWICSHIAIRRDEQCPQVNRLRHRPHGTGARTRHTAPHVQCVWCSEPTCVAELELIG